MLDHLVLECHANALVEALSSWRPPEPNPISVDSWIARSALQKGIRRGELDLALRAAATLLATDRRVFWRRLLVTALEDLGPTSFETIALVTAAMLSSKFRADRQREWATASHLVQRSAMGIRDQSANDLVCIALHAPELAQARLDLCELDEVGILEFAADNDRSLWERAVACLMVLGELREGDNPSHFRADPEGLFAALEDGTGSAALLAAAYRLSRVNLASMNCLLRPAVEILQSTADADDQLPPASQVAEVPGFVLDQYTRTGRRAIAAFTQASARWREFAGRQGLTRPRSADAAGELLFRLEGSKVTRRAYYPLANSLHHRASTLACFVPEAAVVEGMEIICSELPLIDRMRLRSIPT